MLGQVLGAVLCDELFAPFESVSGVEEDAGIGYGDVADLAEGDFLAEYALGLKFAELGEGSVEDGDGAVPGALDGTAGFVGLFGEVAEVGFGGVAEIEAPVGSDDLRDAGFFEEACGVEFEVGGFAEFLVEVAVFGLDVVFSGEEAEGLGVDG